MTNKLYMLYPVGSGYSNNTVDYRGSSYSVAAASSKQAHELARRNVWSTGFEHPQGIIEIYRRGSGPPGDHQLWCGCRLYTGLNLQHLAGIRAIRAAMESHVSRAHD